MPMRPHESSGVANNQLNKGPAGSNGRLWYVSELGELDKFVPFSIDFGKNKFSNAGDCRKDASDQHSRASCEETVMNEYVDWTGWENNSILKETKKS